MPDTIRVKIKSSYDSVACKGYLEAFGFYASEEDVLGLERLDSLIDISKLSKKRICDCKSEYIYQLSELNQFDKTVNEAFKNIDFFNHHCPEKAYKLYRYAGNSQYYLKNYDAAIRSWEASIELLKPYGDGERIADTYMNIGSAYSNQGNYTLALENHNRALDYYEEEKLLESQAICWINLANTMAGQSREDSTQMLSMIPKIIEKYEEAERIFIELKDTLNLAIIYANIGSQYETKRDFKTSNSYLSKSLKLLENIKDRTTLVHILIWKARNHAELGEFEDAYWASHNYVMINDSLINEEKVKAVSEMEAKYQNEKLSKENELRRFSEERAQREKELAERDERIARQDSRSKSIYLYGAFGGLALLIGLAYTFFAGKRKQEKINNELSDANKFIEFQRDEIEAKNKDIEDSITYAKSLQDAILPNIETVERGFPNAFIFFAPRDIVSGDFYWYAERDNYVFLAVADCTGHGVPGAIVSMACSNILDNVVNEKGVTSPAQILAESHKGIVKSFKREGFLSQANDGMDIVIVRYDKETKKICYGGAMNPLFVIRDKRAIEYRANRRGLGGIATLAFEFEEEEIQLRTGDCVYLSTDGFQDQFGGEKGKKYKKKRFKDFLATTTAYGIGQRPKIIQTELENWRGRFEQVDDILIIGFEV